ncbi:MAG: hypothetical protein ACYCXF_07865 [Thermoleophilia bacterium]
MVPIVRTGQSGFFASGAEYSEGAVYLEDGQGRRIGRGIAESVSYANTAANMFRLAGLPDTPETLEQFKRPKPSALLKLWSMLYVAWPRYKAKLGGLLESFEEMFGWEGEGMVLDWLDLGDFALLVWCCSRLMELNLSFTCF